MEPIKNCIIFGGTGFIGTHLTQYLLRNGLTDKIYLADLKPPRTQAYAKELQDGLASGKVVYLHCDVRQPIPIGDLPDHGDLIFNLAAIHREPGHAEHEYYETNLPGATNVCDYATRIGCNRIVFTSSISPYGPSEDPKTEQSEPAPETPYGITKLAAEKIHREWQQGDQARRLLIMRPGVVFGPGEGGNVTRLIRSLYRRYFLYMGNRETRKAGGYVKELCHVIEYALDYQTNTGEGVVIVNFTMDPPTKLERFVEAICTSGGFERRPLSVPRWALLGVSYPIDSVARALKITQPISPVRIRKLFRSTNIEPGWLRARGYQYKYTLEEALSDWKRDYPEEFA
ncbi:MAG: NAD(P)-dependent oxidoreductase [Methylotetracoccus sp.]